MRFRFFRRGPYVIKGAIDAEEADVDSTVFSLYFAEYPTSWGVFRAAASVGGVTAVGLPGEDGRRFFSYIKKKYPAVLLVERSTADLEQVGAEIGEYLSGERREFAVPFHVRATPFQFKVLEAVSAIPYGATATYREIAERVGSPSAARAVGAACAANPIPLIVPCHRVVAAAGLGGYGGGPGLKRKLLEHEGVRLK
jgi:O-6-methylguanine DNA methyltransferase